MNLIFDILDGTYTIHQLQAGSVIPEAVYQSPFYNISKSKEELSIVCLSSIQVNSAQSSAEWSCLKVHGPLDFSLTGILANIAGVLADGGISIFAISTFDTDYVLVKTENLKSAKKYLQEAGHSINPKNK